MSISIYKRNDGKGLVATSNYYDEIKFFKDGKEIGAATKEEGQDSLFLDIKTLEGKHEQLDFLLEKGYIEQEAYDKRKAGLSKVSENFLAELKPQYKKKN